MELSVPVEFVVKVTTPVGVVAVPPAELSVMVTVHWMVPFTREIGGEQISEVEVALYPTNSSMGSPLLPAWASSP